MRARPGFVPRAVPGLGSGSCRRVSLAGCPDPPEQPHARCGRATPAPRGPSASGEVTCLHRRPRRRPGHSTCRVLFAELAKSLSEVHLSGMDLYNFRALGRAVSLLGGFSAAEMPCACPRAKSAASFKGSRSFEWKNCSVKICTLPSSVPSHYIDRLRDLGSILCMFWFYIACRTV